MRKLLISCLIGVCLSLSSCTAREQQGEPALWRISDADSEIWLFGSVHMLKPDLDWRGPRMEAAFAAAEEFVTETDTGAEAAFPALVTAYGALPAGETVSAKLEPSDAARMRRAARDLNLDFGAFDRRRPWLAALQISAARATRLGRRPEAGVEAVLSAEARARGLATWHFESPEDQIRVLADMAEEDQIALLLSVLDETGVGARETDALDRAWAAGNVAALTARLSAEAAAMDPDVREAILFERNRAWADRIEARLQGSGRTFIAVGAAHLVGEDSVVDLLRDRGLDVEGP